MPPLTPAEQAVVEAALLRGYLTRPQVEAALARCGPGQALAALRPLLDPSQLQALQSVFHAQGTVAPGQGTVAPMQGTVAPTQGAVAPSTRPNNVADTRPGGSAPAATFVPTTGQTAADASHPAVPRQRGGLQAGQQLGPYLIEGELGRGAMGVVFTARHQVLGRQVALKVLIGPGNPNSSRIQRFVTEAEAVARLQHPNIVGVHDVGAGPGCYYMAMELVQGESLQDRINRGPIPPLEAARYGLGLANGMAHAHERSILHRDLKPDNVLLDTSRSEPIARVTDFGLAKDTLETAGLTRTGEVMGTPTYMPPEQARGQGAHVDVRADVYSLGATIYAMLAGRSPFEGLSLVAVLAKVAVAIPDPPSKHQKQVPAQLDAIVLKCLEKLPDDRYPSATALAEDLARFIEGDEVEARLKRHGKTPLWIVVPLLVLALAAGLVWALSSPESTKPTDEAASPDRLRDEDDNGAKTEPPPPDETGDPVPSPDDLLRPWRKIEPHGKRPKPRANFGMVYDPKRRVTLVHGGLRTPNRILHDLWEWNGATRTWREIEAVGDKPGPLHGQSMAYDPVRDRVVMYGGKRNPKSATHELWEWNGELQTWKVIGGRGGPGRLAWHGMAWDARREEVAVVGGKHSLNKLNPDLWYWNGRRWYQRPRVEGDGKSPARRYHIGMTFFRKTNQLVVFGGNNKEGLYAFDGRWDSLKQGKVRPGKRENPGLVDTGDHLVMFGGFGGAKRLRIFQQSTWHWDGERWFERSPPGPLPPARSHHGMVWDSRRKVVVLFGGRYNDVNGRHDLDDMWEY